LWAGLFLLAGAGEMLRHPDYFYRANGYGILLDWWFCLGGRWLLGDGGGVAEKI